jgi:hypothetical protein
MFRLPHRATFAIAAALLAVACSQPPPKPMPPAGPPKIGVVGLVSELKERGLTQDNWRGYFGDLVSTDFDHNVARVQYEVTVLYDDGTTGTVKVDEQPSLQPGQKVRVTGDKIEPMRR